MAITLAGVSLDDAAGRWRLNDDTRLRQPPATIINDVIIPGRHGALRADYFTFGPGRALVALDLYGADYNALRANFHAVSALAGSGRNDLRWLVDPPYQALVQYTSTSELVVGPGGVTGSVQFTFSIPSGFWQDVASQDVALASGTSSPTALRGGSAPITDALFLVESGVRVTDADTGAYFQWNGGGSARIDPLRQTAYSGWSWTGGANVSGDLVMGPDNFQLSATMSVTVSGGNATVRARRGYL